MDASQKDWGNKLVYWGGGIAAINLLLLTLISSSTTWMAYVSLSSVPLVNVYIIRVLLECAERSDKGIFNWRITVMPSRKMALLQILFVVLIIVLAFAQMYIANRGIIHTTSCDATKPCSCNFSFYSDDINSKVNATYFSFVTLATVGYGDFVPSSMWARILVIWEIFSGILVLLFALPLVVGRFTMWTNKTWNLVSESLPPAIKIDNKNNYNFQLNDAVIAARWEGDNSTLTELKEGYYCEDMQWRDNKCNTFKPTHWMCVQKPR